MSEGTSLNNIRNIGIIAHIDAGKTTLSERFLYYSGKTYRIGDIDSGTTVLDYLEEERDRGITIVAAAASFDWKSPNASGLIHLIDTPGHIDFTAEVERSVRVIDGALVIFSGVEGVEAQSEKVWRQSEHYHVPKLAFINKLDRPGASFSRTFDEIAAKFPSVKAAAFQLPVGDESAFSGVIDLLRMKALRFTGADGAIVQEEDIPGEMVAECEAAREKLIAAVAELSDAVAEYYLEEKTLPDDLLRREIRKLVIAGKLCPVFAGSAKRNIGAQPALDAIIDYLPSPEDRRFCMGTCLKTGNPERVDFHDHSFCGLVFKVVAGGSADLLYLRSYAGRLAVNDMLLNSRTGEKVRIKRILRLYSKNVEPMEKIGPGDIVGIIGPQNTGTGDTLCSPARLLTLEKIDFPEPVISIAIEPRSSKDKDRLHDCLELLCREDPTLEMKRHENTGQLILSGMGELHLEINANRIAREFHIEARFGKPRVAFRETLKHACTVTGIFDRTLGDAQYYTEVDIHLEPVRCEQGIIVDADIRGKNNIPSSWIHSAKDTLMNGLKTGGNLGYSLIYIKATVKDIRGVPESATDGSVAGAVLEALRQAIAGGTALLEPLMKLDIIAPEEAIGEITGYLQPRRAMIQGLDNIAGARHLRCEVPLAEMFGFSSALPKLSGGRASFSMEPHGYQELSENDLQRLVNDNKVCY
jgi:elongation factor G